MISRKEREVEREKITSEINRVLSGCEKRNKRRKRRNQEGGKRVI